MKLWHCFNCFTDFEAEAAVCTSCGAENEPGQQQIIAQRLVVHFDPPHPIIRGRGKGFHACDPKIKVGTQGMRATGFTGSVTCPVCKASEAWNTESELLTNPPAYRVPTPKVDDHVEQLTPAIEVVNPMASEQTGLATAAKGEA